MRNLYIIITGRLDHIGGGELYTLRRMKYLEKKGFEVIAITGSFKKEEILLNELQNFNVIELENIYYNEKIYIDKLESKIKDLYDQIYIEAHYFWEFAEKLAQRLNTINFIYLIAEQPFFKFSNKSFYLKKLENNEIIGVSEETLRISFGKEWKREKYNNNYVNISFDNNEIQSNKSKEKIYGLERNKEIIRITTVSRFDKTYIEELIKDTIKISKKYIDKKFELILIGDSNNKKIKLKLMSKYQDTFNLKICFLGYINPLFSEIYENTDLFVGMGTALINAVGFKSIALVIDPRNDKTSGFFGSEVKSFAYRSDDKTFLIYDKIEEFLLLDNKEREKLKIKGYDLYMNNFDFLNNMKKLDNYILDEKKYKKIEYINLKREFKYYIKKILFELKILKFCTKLKNKIKPNKKFVNL